MAFIPTLADTDLKRDPRTGYWSICWTVPAKDSPDGKARTRAYSCRTKDRAVAEDVRQAWLTAQHRVAGPGGSTVAEMIDQYTKGHLDAQGRAPSQKDALKPVKAALGQCELLDLTNLRIAEYTAQRRALGRTDGTIRRELGSLRAAIGWCIKTGYLPPGSAVPFIALPPASQGRLNVLDEADEAKLFAFCESIVYRETPNHPWWRAALFVCIALTAPGRTAAIEGLTWSQITWPRGNHPGLIDYRQAGARRTKKRRVPLPISTRLLPVLQHAWTYRIANGTDGGFVLVKPGSVRRAFASVIKAAGVRRVTRHDLRRTWASLAAGRDVDLYKIAAVLGDTFQTTEKNYAHLSPSYLVGAVNP